MNREEVTDAFIKEHLRPLTDPSAQKDQVKQLRIAFCSRRGLHSEERFSQRVLADRVVHVIAAAHRDWGRDELTKALSEMPWLRAELGDARIAEQVELLELGRQSTLKPDDLRRLREERYLSEVEETISNRVQAEAERRLEDEHRRLLRTLEALRAKQEDLDSRRSVLDSEGPESALDAQANDANAETTDRSPLVAWWQDLGLESDPFFSNKALHRIPKSKFDSVVVQTPFVKEFIDKIARDPTAYFSQAIVVLGEYGSGKSTLFELLEYRSATGGILPLFITLSPNPSVSNLVSRFVTQLGEGLGSAYPELFDHLPVRPHESPDDFGACISAMKAGLTQHSSNSGYYVFVDGLHLPDTFRRQSLEFLQHLQTFQERCARSSVPVAIFVAGIPSWSEDIAGFPGLSGAISEVTTIPPISAENAVEAVIRRLLSFTPPGVEPPEIVRLPLRRGFDVLAERLRRPPTFRQYLEDVRGRLVARDYASVGISISVHLETISEVQRAFSESALGPAYSRLNSPGNHSPFRTA